MVHGLEIFKRYFIGYDKQYTIIGGVACDTWFDTEGLTDEFRATKDFDVVLIIEVLNDSFLDILKKFLHDGGYSRSISKQDERLCNYRFTNPSDAQFPKQIELFSPKPNDSLINTINRVVPVIISEDITSFSAILLDDDYYELLKTNSTSIDGISILNLESIIPFKVKAWLNQINLLHRFRLA